MVLTFVRHSIRTVWAILFLASMASAQSVPEAAAPAAAANMTELQSQWLRSNLRERVRIAERIGESGAEALAKKLGYVPILRNGDKTLSQGFDQVYLARNGGIVVIEAKGGTSAISQAYGCKQGTPEWAIEAAKRVAKSPNASAAEKHTAQVVLEAAKEGRLTVQVVRTRHVLGEPVAAVLESTLKAGQAESKAATIFLQELGQGAKAARTASQTAKVAEVVGEVVEEASHQGGKLSKLCKAAGFVGVFIDAGVRTNSAMGTEQKFRKGEISDEERELAHAKNVAGMAGGWGGAAAGTSFGAQGGALAGSIVPGPGTAVGTAIGAAAGGIAGYFAGEEAAGHASTWAVQSVHNNGTTIAETTSQAWKWCTSSIHSVWNRVARN